MLTDSLTAAQFNLDLEWIRRSPPLMALDGAQDGTAFIQSLAMDVRPTDQICQTLFTRRLGTYYENLINSILEDSNQLIEIKRNIQVIPDKTTLGEYDFLMREQSGRCIHLECAVKFYLCTGDASELSAFHGPNRRDRLDLKWNKLLEKQIRLSETPAGQATAKRIGILPDARMIMLQGYLFYPVDQTPNRNCHPALSPNHLRGWWARARQLEAVLADTTYFRILEKPHWLACPETLASDLLNKDGLADRVKQLTHPFLVARLDKKDGMIWKEKDRGFIVPDRW